MYTFWWYIEQKIRLTFSSGNQGVTDWVNDNPSWCEGGWGKNM